MNSNIMRNGQDRVDRIRLRREALVGMLRP